MQIVPHYTSYIKDSKAAEKENNYEKAANLYEKAIKLEPLFGYPYNRLMIIYSKTKQYA